jgi:hypothetical protein
MTVLLRVPSSWSFFVSSRTLGRLTLFNHGAIAITDITSMAFTDRHASPNRTNVNANIVN